jgi:dTDP-4-amino-4,6-dideoxygalactose transaminase
MDWQTPLFKIYWDKNDVAAVEKALRRGMNWAVGPEVTQFEENLAAYLKVKYCLTFNSGTSALHAALLAYGIGPGDEVIVPSFTFIATANAALFVGAKPVFADIEEKTCGLDAADVERKITPKTKAIIPIHYGGNPCQIEAMREVARKYNLTLIEDAAEALGAKVNSSRAGSFGDAAVLSFCQNKTITTGEGGAITTNSEEIYDKLKLIRSHGRLEDKGSNYFSSTKNMDYVTLGYNFRMSNITAALGLAQLNKLDKIVEMRRNCARRYDSRLSKINSVIIPQPSEGSYHVYQMYSIRVPGNLRDGLMQHLANNGIMGKVFFYPVHKTHFYSNELKYDCALSVTETVSSQVLCLPMHPKLGIKEIDKITGHVAEYLAKEK